MWATTHNLNNTYALKIGTQLPQMKEIDRNKT